MQIYGFAPKDLAKKAITKARHKTLYTIMRVITPSIYYNSKPFPRPMIRFLKEYYGKRFLIGAEIGTARGHNTRNIFQNLNITQFYCIDPYTPYVGARGIPHKEYVSTYARAKQVLRKYHDNILFLKMTSKEATKKIHSTLDFIYIDGNHSYEVVKQDLESYYPLVKKGGVMGGHDFTVFYWEVCKAVIEFAEKQGLELQGKIQADWWVIKK